MQFKRKEVRYGSEVVCTATVPCLETMSDIARLKELLPISEEWFLQILNSGLAMSVMNYSRAIARIKSSDKPVSYPAAGDIAKMVSILDALDAAANKRI